MKVGTSKFYRITIFLVAFLNTVVLPRLPYLPKVSLLSISFNFFNRWFSISAMRSWCSNCAILICACSNSARGSCSYLRLPRPVFQSDLTQFLVFQRPCASLLVAYAILLGYLSVVAPSCKAFLGNLNALLLFGLVCTFYAAAS